MKRAKSACARARRWRSPAASPAAPQRADSLTPALHPHFEPRIREPCERAGQVRFPRSAALREGYAEEDVCAVEERDGGRDDQRAERLAKQPLSDQEPEVADH